MAICYVTGNIPTDTVVQATEYPPIITDPNSFTVLLDDSDQMVKDVMADTTTHKFSEVMTGKPYVKLQYNGANLIITLINPPTTVPTSVTMSVLGQSVTVNLTSGQTTVPFTIHPSVPRQRVQITVNTDGFPYSYIDIAGAYRDVTVQAYKDTNGTYNIVPVNAIDLANYYTQKDVDTKWSDADFKTVTDFLVDAVFNVILPSLNVTLTTEQTNGLNDIKANVVPYLNSTLATINPTGTQSEMHYASYQYHNEQAKSAMDSYVSDKTEITKYTTLK